MTAPQYFFDAARWKFTNLLLLYQDKLIEEASQVPRDSWIPYSNQYVKNNGIQGKNYWLFPFLIKGERFQNNIDHCPAMASLLDQIPCDDNCVFSLLGPGESIAPHRGHGDHFVRVHMPLKTDGQAWIRVGDQTRYWQMDQVLIFSDWDEHEVGNPSHQERLILLLDVDKHHYYDNLI